MSCHRTVSSALTACFLAKRQSTGVTSSNTKHIRASLLVAKHVEHGFQREFFFILYVQQKCSYCIHLGTPHQLRTDLLKNIVFNIMDNIKETTETLARSLVHTPGSPPKPRPCPCGPASHRYSSGQHVQLLEEVHRF